MSSKDVAIEVALLEIAKDLLQASDDLAATDPSASAKLAHEAYEIGRDLGIVRNHLEEPERAARSLREADSAAVNGQADRAAHVNGHGNVNGNGLARANGGGSYREREIEDESDVDLFRILDRQRAIVPDPSALSSARRPSRSSKERSLDQAAPRRSGWFGWMRPSEWRHAG